MKILIITACYPGVDIPKDITPVVHYFARQWVKSGHDVHVIHSVPKFPQIVYPLLMMCKNLIQNKYGGSFLTRPLKDDDYVLEGVHVHRRSIYKSYPHSLYTDKSLNQHAKQIEDFVKSISYIPDVISIHWDRPGLNIISRLLKKYNIPVAFIAHGAPPATSANIEALKSISLIGYRSEPIRQDCIKQFDLSDKQQFMCYSGIPQALIPNEVDSVSSRRRIYTYVGIMVKRKHPEALLEALKNDKGSYFINYIGTGAMQSDLKALSQKYKMAQMVNFAGRVPREKVCKLLQETKCFIMISSGEAFGLVYIEAMANGCITIASRGEGMDGIIQDGINGFLCESGNYTELKNILDRIESMSCLELDSIADAARKTVNQLTDEIVADMYLRELMKIAKH